MKFNPALLLCFTMLLQRRRNRRDKEKQRVRKRPWKLPHLYLHEEQGVFPNLIQELRCNEEEKFRNFLRMPPKIFDELLVLVTHLIKVQNTSFRASISPAERLAITLRFLATGETYRSLSYTFRVGETTIGLLVPKTCSAIYQVLQPEFLKCPQTKEEWKSVAKGFQEKWNFPNCIGALDGKHINIRPPIHSGSKYFNYKQRFSIVLMALVDADYKFLYVDVGCNGKVSDGGVFRACTLDQSMRDRTANIPDPTPYPGDDTPMAYTIVADDAFPLRDDIMKPYPYRSMELDKRVYNYRLSRARRVVENAFGIMANKFRVLLTNIALPPKTIDKIVMASCALHNYLHVKIGNGYMAKVGDSEDPATHDITAGLWRKDPQIEQAALNPGTNPTKKAKAHRDLLKSYFNSELGAVDWQWGKC
ncbi:PREDICTED: uncharacterized protein LOC106808559 [Priapulus caudatus]|uniref:Uncharacterized protein LOC106808559 n=1 Tax=Priapulus caudatus TaxID=37621 RepID=A0ABM1E3N7_PRICU|nr:PREDICTED: uncharacterized protein LOC106808559 [Priapulus caudatus]